MLYYIKKGVYPAQKPSIKVITHVSGKGNNIYSDDDTDRGHIRNMTYLQRSCM